MRLLQLFPVYLLLVSASCNFSTYLRSTSQIPLFKEKNELTANAFLGTNHFEIQGAYSYANHLAVQGGMYGGTNGYFFEAGNGYFHPINNNYLFEIFAGAGKGVIASVDTSFTRLLKNPYWERGDATYYSVFIQPTAGFAEKNFQFALSIKTAYILYTKYLYESKIYDKDKNGVTYLSSHDSIMASNKGIGIIMPSLTFKAGWTHLKFFVQGQTFYSTKLFNSIDKKIFNYLHPVYNPLLVSIGIQCWFSIKKKVRNNSD